MINPFFGIKIRPKPESKLMNRIDIMISIAIPKIFIVRSTVTFRAA